MPNLHQWSPSGVGKNSTQEDLFGKTNQICIFEGKISSQPKKKQYKNKGFNLEDYNCNYSDLDDSSDRKGDEVVFG